MCAAPLETRPIRTIQRLLARRALDVHPVSGQPNYEPDPPNSLRAPAAAEGCSVEETGYDALLADDGEALLFLPIAILSGSFDHAHDLLVGDRTLIDLGGGGAHLGLICDASYPHLSAQLLSAGPGKERCPAHIAAGRRQPADAAQRGRGRPC